MSPEPSASTSENFLPISASDAPPKNDESSLDIFEMEDPHSFLLTEPLPSLSNSSNNFLSSASPFLVSLMRSVDLRALRPRNPAWIFVAAEFSSGSFKSIDGTTSAVAALVFGDAIWGSEFLRLSPVRAWCPRNCAWIFRAAFSFSGSSRSIAAIAASSAAIRRSSSRSCLARCPRKEAWIFVAAAATSGSSRSTSMSTADSDI
mmetsp:Transcript_3639/g.9067  ORF Transcript_3639/g.9067 Transcript_3639/m.9067 type:complete len:204 (-) Transcript_3639:431-1042(-)